MATTSRIAVARGDCMVINMTLLSDGQPLELTATDTVELTVRARNDPASPILLHKVSEPGSGIIELHAEDTRSMEPGQYSADVRFLHDGCTYTIWGVSENDTRVRNLRNFYVLAGVSEDVD